MRQAAKTSAVVGCILVIMLMLGVPDVVASPNVLVMPNRDAFKGQTIVVWGNTKFANGTPFTLDFGDATAPFVGNVVDQSYITANHVYNTAGTFTVTLTVGAESETATVKVTDPAAVNAFTQRGLRINMAIEDGLRFLYFSQLNRAATFLTNMTSWTGTGSDSTSMAYTALAVLSFENHGHHVTNDPNKSIYQPVVQRGLNFLFDRLIQVQLQCPEPAGNPCVNVPAPVNVGLATTGNNGYATPIVAGAVAAAAGVAPGRIVAAGLGSANANFVAGKTYAEILQRLSNTVVWGQTDSVGIKEGGWIYGLDQFDSDGSTNGWGILGLIDSAAAGATVPAFAKTEFAKTLAAGLNNNGSYDYRADGNPAANSSNPAKTGVGIQGLAFTGAPVGDARVQAALAYLVRNWNAQVDPLDFNCAGGTPTATNKGCGYAMFNVFKGLRLYGIVTLPGIGRPAGPGAIPADDWYADYVDNLLANQHSPSDPSHGEWTPFGAPTMGWSCCDSNVNGVTSLAELILAPVAFINPSTLDLTPANATNPPGTQHTVTATAKAANGAPVPGATVQFNVIAGPNAGVSGSAVTNGNGQASFTYADPPGVTGTDQIRANIGQLQSNIALKTWSGGPPDIAVTTGNLTKVGDLLDVEIKLRNTGASEAKNVKITVVTPTAPVTYVSPALPIVVGNIASGATVSTTIRFNLHGLASGSTARFTIKGSFQDAGGNNFQYGSIRGVKVP